MTCAKALAKDNDELTYKDYDYVVNKSQGENLNGHEIIAAVKTNSGWFPKDEITKKMAKWPAGSRTLSWIAPHREQTFALSRSVTSTMLARFFCHDKECWVHPSWDAVHHQVS